MRAAETLVVGGLRVLVLAATIALGVSSCAPREDVAEQSGSETSALYGFDSQVDMTSTTGRASTVGFATITKASGAGRCSGTLVARNKVLLAAHCVCSSGVGSVVDPILSITFFLPQAGGFTANAVLPVQLHPATAPFPFPGTSTCNAIGSQDIAVVTLAIDVPVSVVEQPARVFLGHLESALESAELFGPIEQVGFGATTSYKAAPGDPTVGTRRIGTASPNLVKDPCDKGVFEGACSDYFEWADSVNPALNSVHAPGDSGGPLFMEQLGLGTAVVGVTSGWHSDYHPLAADKHDVQVWAPVGNIGSINTHIFLANALGGDPDGDSWPTDSDNCPLEPNFTQFDFDGDGVGEACDNCPSTVCFGSLPDQDCFNPLQGNRDGDAWGDTCDLCPHDGGGFDVTANQPDSDGDGVGNACDGCAGQNEYVTCAGDVQCNATTGSFCVKETSAFGHCSKQQDVDNDEIPDVCDNCKSLANQTDVNTNALSEERERATFPTLETLGDDCDPVPVVRVAKQTATPIVQGLAPPPSVFLPGDRWLGEQSQFEPPATFGGLRVGYRHCDCFDQASGEALPLEQCVGALKQCPWDDPTNDSANWRRPSITSLVTGTPVMDASGLSTPLTFERGAAINYPASWSWCDDLGSGQVMGQGSCFPSTENGSTHGAIATVVSGAPVSIRDTGKNLRDTFKLYTTPLVDEYTPQILDVQSCSIIPCLSWFNPNIYINPWEGLDFGNQFVAPVLLDGAPGSIQVNPGGTQSFDVTAKISSGTGALIADPTALWLSPAEASYRLRQKHAAARVQAVAMPKDLAPGIAVELVLATPGGLVTERERPDVPAIAAAAASALPTSRRDIQAVFSGTEQAVYVVGGVDDEGEADQSIARYGLDNRSWETLRADVRFVPSAVVFAVTYDALRSQLYVLDLDDEPILPKLRQVRLIRIDVQTGDSALLAKWPRVGLFEQLRLAALDDGSLALIGARAHVYNVWRVVPHGDGIEYGGHFLGLGTLLGQPVMGEEHLVLAVKRNKTLEYVTLSPDRFHGKGQCGAL